MDVGLSLALIASAALPWAAGWLWALALLRQDSHPALIAGLGVLIGYLLVAAGIAVLGSLGLKQGFWPMVVFLLVSMFPAALLVRNRSPSSSVGQQSLIAGWRQTAVPIRWLCIVLLMLITVRIVSWLPDILLRPVFPWDAWQVFLYKARLWFEAGELVGLAHPREWLDAPIGKYVAVGTDHPPLVSLVMLWQALAVGYWDDSLLGLPWLMCGLACCLMLFGALRQESLPVWGSLLAVFVLVSLPMFATHVALVGYADLWTGAWLLAFAVALRHWFASPSMRLIGVMLLAAIAVVLLKDTGSYWLAVLIPAFVAGLVGARLAVVGLVLGVAACIGLFVWGQDPVVWLTDGRFRLDPAPLGSVISGILHHMFVWSDWHMLWFGVPVVLILGARQAISDAGVRALYAMILIGLGLLFVSFVFTRAGQYVVIGTLVSRMLLHLVPALILLTAIVLFQYFKQSEKWTARPVYVAISIVLAGSILWLGGSFWYASSDRYKTVLPSVELFPQPGLWQIMEGQGSVLEGKVELTMPGRRGDAVIGIQLANSIDASDFEVIELMLEHPAQYQDISIGWSRSAAMSGFPALPVERGEDGISRIRTAGMPGWNDEIQYLTVHVRGYMTPPIVLQSMTLQPASPDFAGLQARWLSDWFTLAAWTQASSNRTVIGLGQFGISILMAGIAWVLFGVLIYAIFFRRDWRDLIGMFFLTFVAIWLFQDLRWQADLIHRAHATWDQFAGKSIKEKQLTGEDAPEFRLMSELKAEIDDLMNYRLFILSDQRYVGLRARYHALPISARFRDDDLELTRRMIRKWRPGDLITLADVWSISAQQIPQTEGPDVVMDYEWRTGARQQATVGVLRKGFHRVDLVPGSDSAPKEGRLEIWRWLGSDNWDLVTERDLSWREEPRVTHVLVPMLGEGLVRLRWVSADEPADFQVSIRSLNDDRLYYLSGSGGGPYMVVQHLLDYEAGATYRVP